MADDLERAIAAAEREVYETSQMLTRSLSRQNSFEKNGQPLSDKISSLKPSPKSLPKSSPKSQRRAPGAGLGLMSLSNDSKATNTVHGVPVSPVEESPMHGGGGARGLIAGLVVLAVFLILLHTASPAELFAPPRSPPDAGTIDHGDTAWMLTSTMLVLLMVPALGLFEAGLLRAKNSVSVLMQCLAGLALGTTMWFAFGFSLCFSQTDGFLGLVGSLDHAFLAGVWLDAPLPNAPTVPAILFCAYQGMFATITPLLCTGAFAERLRFEAFLGFTVAWSVLVYYPLARAIWGGGILAKLGVLDFAGGIVIHTTAGAASLVTALRLGPRAGFAGSVSKSLAPHNLPMAATGAGLLWAGWFGFNGGSALTSGVLASATLMTTHIAGATGCLVWLLLDWCHLGRPTFVGAINGALSGLAGVTPASGYVTPAAGFAIGLLVGIASYLGVLLFKDVLKVDDALDVSSIHGVTGVLGSLLIGVYGSTAVNPAGADASLSQFLVQLVGVGVAATWSAIGTWAVMGVLGMFVGLRADDEEESKGLDHSQHGERSYLDLQALV